MEATLQVRPNIGKPGKPYSRLGKLGQDANKELPLKNS